MGGEGGASVGCSRRSSCGRGCRGAAVAVVNDGPASPRWLGAESAVASVAASPASGAGKTVASAPPSWALDAESAVASVATSPASGTSKTVASAPSSCALNAESAVASVATSPASGTGKTVASRRRLARSTQSPPFRERRRPLLWRRSQHRRGPRPHRQRPRSPSSEPTDPHRHRDRLRRQRSLPQRLPPRRHRFRATSS